MNHAAEQLAYNALTLALKADTHGVEIYDYAIAGLEESLAFLREWESNTNYDGVEEWLRNIMVACGERRCDNFEEAIRVLRNLREMWMADEVEWMLTKAPLKQGDARDGVVE